MQAYFSGNFEEFSIARCEHDIKGGGVHIIMGHRCSDHTYSSMHSNKIENAMYLLLDTDHTHTKP